MKRVLCGLFLGVVCQGCAPSEVEQKSKVVVPRDAGARPAALEGGQVKELRIEMH